MIEIENSINTIKKFPLLAFFFMTFVISWCLFFIYILFPNEVSILLIFIAIYAPAITALILSRITGFRQNDGKKIVRLVIFIIVWAIATTVFIINYYMQTSDLSIVITVGAIFLGLLPALMISSGFSHNSDVRMVFQSYIKPKGHFVWYLVAILLMPGSLLLGAVITLLLGQNVS